MNMLEAEYARKDRENEVREVMRASEIKKLLASQQTNAKNDNQSVRNAVGSKLVEWGERLQDGQSAPKPATLKI